MSEIKAGTLDLVALDELLDHIPAAGPRYMWVSEGFVDAIIGVDRNWKQAESLGYSDPRTYRRELDAVCAFHGPRLLARLSLAVAAVRDANRQQPR